MEKLDKMDIQTPKEKTEIDPRSKTTAETKLITLSLLVKRLLH